MTDTNQRQLFTSFGGNLTPTWITVANRGFTARKLTVPSEGFSFNESFELINGHVGVGNSSSQTLTVPNVFVDERSAGPLVLSISPDKTGPVINKLFRVKLPLSDEIENMNYNADTRGDRSGDSTTGVDKTNYIFSQAILGPKFGLRLTGKVTVAQTGAKLVKQQTSGTATEEPVTFGASPTGGTYFFPEEDLDGTIYGYWKVITTVQGVMGEYDSFILKSGSNVPEDDILQTLDGKPVKFSLMDEISSEGVFLNDYLVSSTKYQIVKSFLTNDISFPPNTRIPEGTVVSLSDFVEGTDGNVDVDENLSNTSSARFFVYAYDKYPRFQFKLYEGSKIDVPVTIRDGCSLPAGYVATVGTSTDDEDGTVITGILELVDLRAPPGTLLPANLSLEGVVLEGERARIPMGESSAQLQNLPLGSKTNKVQVLNGAVFPVNGSLASDVKFLNDIELSVSVVGTTGTKVTAGSVLPKGALTLEGAHIKDGFIIAAGSTVTDTFDISTPFVIAPNGGGSSLGAGAILRGPFTFPPGTQITDGNLLPAAFKILMSMNVTLAAAMEISAGTFFGAAANLYGNIGFSPKGVIPALSTLHGNINIPAGAKIEKETVLNVNVPIPPSRMHTGDTLFAGTSIREGTPLPPLLDIADQAGPAYVSGSTAAGPLTKFTENGIVYLVVKAGTTFISGFYFPVGCVLSKKASAGHTGSLGNDSINGANEGLAPDYRWDAGEFSSDRTERSPAAQDFTFFGGLPTIQLVVALTDVNFESDMLLPLDMIDNDSLKYLALQEPFVLASDLVLSEDYVIGGNKSVTWPANHPIPFDFVFTNPFSFTTPTSGTPLNKDIQFNTRTTEKFFYGVLLDSASYLKLPFKGYKLLTPIKLALDQPVASNGLHAFKATLELAKGTKLDTLAGYVSTQLPMNVENDFVIGATMTTFPRIYLPHGISLLAGQSTPGEIPVGAGQGLPKNVTLSSAVTLAEDHIISESTYTFPQYTLLKAGSSLARRSVFPQGLSVEQRIEVSPFLSLGTDNIFMVNEENRFSSDLLYPYLVEEDGTMSFMKLDSRGLLEDFARLQAVVEALQAQLETR